MSRRPDALPSAVPVPSPCIDVCCIDARTGWCEGCRRTLDEIACWSSMDDAAKRAVWEQLATRQPGSAAAKEAPR